MDLRPVRGPGDIQRGISFPGPNPAVSSLHSPFSRVDVGEFPWQLDDAQQQMARQLHAQRMAQQALLHPSGPRNQLVSGIPWGERLREGMRRPAGPRSVMQGGPLPPGFKLPPMQPWPPWPQQNPPGLPRPR